MTEYPLIGKPTPRKDARDIVEGMRCSASLGRGRFQPDFSLPDFMMIFTDGCLGSAAIDTAIFEETVLDTRMGRIMNANLVNYKGRTFAELPAMEHVIRETPVPSHRFHAIGVADVAPSPGPAAVVMAVSSAIGVRLTQYPLTPDRILAAMVKIPGKEDGK